MSRPAPPFAEDSPDNLLRLNGPCAPHRFVCIRPAEDGRPGHGWYRCEACGGVASGRSRGWYESGVRHGRMEARRDLGRVRAP